MGIILCRVVKNRAISLINFHNQIVYLEHYYTQLWSFVIVLRIALNYEIFAKRQNVFFFLEL